MSPGFLSFFAFLGLPEGAEGAAIAELATEESGNETGVNFLTLFVADAAGGSGNDTGMNFLPLAVVIIAGIEVELDEFDAVTLEVELPTIPAKETIFLRAGATGAGDC